MSPFGTKDNASVFAIKTQRVRFLVGLCIDVLLLCSSCYQWTTVQLVTMSRQWFFLPEARREFVAQQASGISCENFNTEHGSHRVRSSTTTRAATRAPSCHATVTTCQPQLHRPNIMCQAFSAASSCTLLPIRKPTHASALVQGSSYRAYRTYLPADIFCRNQCQRLSEISCTVPARVMTLYITNQVRWGIRRIEVSVRLFQKEIACKLAATACVLYEQYCTSTVLRAF